MIVPVKTPDAFARKLTIVSFSCLQLPLTLLRTAQGNPMLVELKNGDTYNGRLVNCDAWMNINLKEVNQIMI
jgi:small nuclear ribonucleoprotein (snRNP)-like protein